MLRMRRITLTVTALLALPLQSCCSLARLFCGPDKSEWVSVRFDTPDLAVRTFLEALRRDDPSVIYECLSEPLRAHLGIDKDTTKIIWPKFRDQVTGLHMAGYAVVPNVNRTSPDAASVQLDVEGQPLPLELVRQCHWEVRYSRPGQTGPRASALVGGQVANAAEFLTVTPTTDSSPTSIVSLNGQSVVHWGLDELPPENIEAIGLVHTWRIHAIGEVRPPAR